MFRLVRLQVASEAPTKARAKERERKVPGEVFLSPRDEEQRAGAIPKQTRRPGCGPQSAAAAVDRPG